MQSPRNNIKDNLQQQKKMRIIVHENTFQGTRDLREENDFYFELKIFHNY